MLECHQSTVRPRSKVKDAMEATKLRGHKRSVLCCESSRTNPHLIASSSEDGSVRIFDLRCKESASAIDLGSEPVASVCFKPGNDDILYAASGNSVNCLDLRMAASNQQLQKYTFNTEDINQITLNSKSCYLLAADDSGEIKVIDIHQHCVYKTLRAVHTNICSCVQFHPRKPWEVISGGLDSKILTWDFSRGRVRKMIDLGAAVSSNADSDTSTNQICNPPFVHALAVPEGFLQRGDNQVVAVARGDGAIEIIDLEYETHMGVSKNKKSQHASKGSQGKLAKNVNAKESNTTEETEKQMRIKLHVGLGGHTAAASCVAFSKFGEAGKLIISGSNDASIKVWNWTSKIETIETCSRDEGPLSYTISNKRKVNWLCTTSHSSENLIVCDTSRVIKAYSIL
ncbi:hypothetical protein SUGI_0780810 [Cryptomeria japonica]|uniref:uncharacterized protein LOC131057189 n=1 Tax=Cryptomeria japonica TaxID=3369 RepID=UPI0024147993|nr:uncharacterized protein LOC131057189 [Cryptomeria japonica]GLJ38336.1 hypothetical protein SUGI_0780810 [Cryptomeria japonica]